MSCGLLERIAGQCSPRHANFCSSVKKLKASRDKKLIRRKRRSERKQFGASTAPSRPVQARSGLPSNHSLAHSYRLHLAFSALLRCFCLLSATSILQSTPAPTPSQALAMAPSSPKAGFATRATHGDEEYITGPEVAPNISYVAYNSPGAAGSGPKLTPAFAISLHP